MRKWLVCLLLTSSLYATQFKPWFSPLWEFQGRLSYLFDKERQVQSPLGNFNAPSNDYTFQFSLGLTPWPDWNAEVELFLTHTSDIPFSYLAALGTIRYQWLDDIRGDPISLVTGVTFSFPGSRELRDFSFPFHAEVNGEFHVTMGKEWSCHREWWLRVWALGGWGIANQGNGWLHGIGALSIKPSSLEWGVITEALVGLGPNNITPNVPFEGYASIDHRTVDLASYLSHHLGCWGTLRVMGWYNVYAHNFLENYWGVGATLLIPFSL
ncbi:MAG: hypothetical protein S4CHLAM2_02880 [Chlamydiales bacterium]|nr:hypothetical protein [Chlamydiales bacterium]